MWQECKELNDYLVGIRRNLHQIPELSTDLPKTQAAVCAELDKLGIEYKKNNADSGIIGIIKGGKPGKTILLRADMDALHITEQTGLPFASTNGCMHACGHDAHAAMLLGALKVINKNKDKLNGNVKFVFQTGEETCKGAKIAIKEGVLDGVDAVFGMHIGSILDPKIPSGTFIVIPGCCMASYDRFILKVKGTGCHGSTPEKGVDPVTIASHIVISLQEVIAREIAAPSPAVITIGKIGGGFAYNVIPNEVEIEGTTRAFDDGVRQFMAKRIVLLLLSGAAAITKWTGEHRR